MAFKKFRNRARNSFRSFRRPSFRRPRFKRGFGAKKINLLGFRFSLISLVIVFLGLYMFTGFKDVVNNLFNSVKSVFKK